MSLSVTGYETVGPVGNRRYKYHASCETHDSDSKSSARDRGHLISQQPEWGDCCSSGMDEVGGALVCAYSVEGEDSRGGMGAEAGTRIVARSGGRNNAYSADGLNDGGRGRGA